MIKKETYKDCRYIIKADLVDKEIHLSETVLCGRRNTKIIHHKEIVVAIQENTPLSQARNHMANLIINRSEIIKEHISDLYGIDKINSNVSCVFGD